MNASRRFTVVEHLPDAELDDAIDAAQLADETRLVRRLCFVKNFHQQSPSQERLRKITNRCSMVCLLVQNNLLNPEFTFKCSLDDLIDALEVDGGIFEEALD